MALRIFHFGVYEVVLSNWFSWVAPLRGVSLSGGTVYARLCEGYNGGYINMSMFCW